MSKKRYRNRHTPVESHTGSWLWAAFLMTCTGLVVIFIVISQNTPAASTPPASAPAPHYAQSMVGRTITFVAPGTLDTQKDHAQVSLVKGSLPSGGSVHRLTVLSDENCVPDAQGISHCLNRLSYGSGEITVRHNHRIADIPCLEPGEVLQLIS